MAASIPKPIGMLGALAGLVGFSVLAGVLVTAMVTPALAVTSMTARSTVGVFEDLPDYLEVGTLAQRNTLWATQGGVPVVLAQVYDQNREEVSWENVSQYVKDAAVAGEDERFYEHGGVDLAGIARAAVNNATSDGTQGASTITQQLVKNVLIAQALNIPDKEKRDQAIANAQAGTLDRKLKEAKLAIGLEKRYTKQEILLGYLNIAGYGGNTYGIQSAAQQYYSTNARDVTVAQAASLIAIVQAPNRRSPANPENWAANQSRRDAILGNMLEQKKIDQAQYDTAIATPVDATTVIVSEPKNGCQYATGAKFFCDYVVRKVPDLEALGSTPDERKANWKKGGYDVYTTVDLDQQAVSEGLLQQYAPAEEARFAMGAANSVVQVGTGRILVMAQNKTYDATDVAPPTSTAVNYNTDSGYGGSTGFPSGSAYKLFTLVNWLQNGHGLNERVDGTQKTYTNKMLPSACAPGNVPFPVKNDGGGNRGQMTVTAATSASVNAAFYSMASELDLCEIQDSARSLGVHRADGDPLQTFASIVLGTDEVAPLTMANAYATIANGGVLCKTIAVDKVVAADGTELAGENPECAPAIAPEIAAAAAFALQGVMNGGTGAASNPRDGTPLIGKTGTADAFHTWILTASTKVASAVWVGNIVGKQSLRRISVAGISAGNSRHSIQRPLMASLNKSPYGVGAAKFPAVTDKLLRGSTQPVPPIAGLDIGKAQSLIESLGLKFQLGGAVASELPVGRAVSSNPGVGTLVSKGSTVEVSTSDGSLATIVPAVAGQKQKDAVASFVAAGFAEGSIAFSYVASAPGDNCLVTGSDPAAGTAASKTAAVTLTVNGGVIVPGKTPECK